MTTAAPPSPNLKPDRYLLEQVERLLDYTEGLQERAFMLTKEGKAGFSVDEEMMEKTGAAVNVSGLQPHPFLRFHIGDDEFDISADSVVQAYKLIGLQAKYAEKTPMKLVSPHLDYWFRNKGGEQKALIKNGEKVISFCRPGTTVYSTRRLLSSMLQHIPREHASILNFYHDLDETHFTLLDESRTKRLKDGSTLTAGIQFQTSLVGLKPVSMSPFVLRSMTRTTAGEEELYEGGAMSTATPPVNWDRNTDKQRMGLPPEEAELLGTVYDYVAQHAEFVLNAAVEEFDRVQALFSHLLDDHGAKFLDDIVGKYKLPPRLYAPVMQEFSHSESTRTVLELWMAFGHLGVRDLELTPRLRRMVYQTAGELARHPAACNTCHRSLPDYALA